MQETEMTCVILKVSGAEMKFDACRKQTYVNCNRTEKMKRGQNKETGVTTQSRTAHAKTDMDIKKNQPRSLKVPSTRYGQQNYLKEQNQLLIGTNEDLQRQLEEKKETVSDLEQRCTDLQEENREIQKQLQDCHVLLVAEKLDPVSGEKLGQTAQQKEEQRKEVMTLSQSLLTELKRFSETTQDHAERLLEVQNTMKEVTDAHEKLQQERALFSLDMEELEKALGDAEKLLMD